MSLFGSFKAAALDLYRGVLLTPLWWRVSVEQTVTRYRRSLLGPVWMASTTLATAFSLAIVFGVALEREAAATIVPVVAVEGDA